MADMNDQREGGLFSDDYEIPKRENPYKKKKQKEEPKDRSLDYVPSEDKPIPEKRENPYTRNKRKKDDPTSSSQVEEDTTREADDTRIRDDDEGTHVESRPKSLKDRWSDFIFTHVKLICFIGGVIFLLLFISAPAIYDGIKAAQKEEELASKQPLTLTYVQGLADKSSPITWSDLVSFPYDESKTSDSVTWMIRVKGTNYEVWISGKTTQNLPTYVYLFDMSTGDKVDLSEGLSAVEDFLEDHGT